MEKFGLGVLKREQAKRTVLEVTAAAEEQARRYEATIARQRLIIDRLQAKVLACKENHGG